MGEAVALAHPTCQGSSSRAGSRAGIDQPLYAVPAARAGRPGRGDSDGFREAAVLTQNEGERTVLLGRADGIT